MRRALFLPILVLLGCGLFRHPQGDPFEFVLNVSLEASKTTGTVPFDTSFHLRILNGYPPFKLQFTDQPDVITSNYDFRISRHIETAGVHTFIAIVTDQSGWSVIRTINVIAP